MILEAFILSTNTPVALVGHKECHVAVWNSDDMAKPAELAMEHGFD